MHKKLAVSIFSVFAIAAWIIFFDPLANQSTLPPIRIATSPWTGFELLHLADKKGFFKEEGVAVKLIRFSAREDARRAYERGQTDGLTGAMIELIKARENGRSAKALLVTDYSNGSAIIAARKGIDTLADLKGKTVAVEPESFGISMVASALEKSGIYFDDINLKGVNQLNISTALLSGEIDAAYVYSPFSTALMKNKDKVTKLMDSSDIPGEIIDVIGIDSDVMAKRPEDMLAIRRAWDKAVKYSRAHPHEANILMSGIENISQQDFTDDLAGVKLFDTSEQEPLMAKGGELEHVLIKVNSLLHREDSQEHPINPDEYILHFEGNRK